MAITSGVNVNFKREVMLGEHDLNSNTLKIVLISSTGASATPSGPDTYASIGTQLASGAGYTTGGATCTAVTVTNVSSSGILDFADVSWADATFTAGGAILYNDSHSSKSIISVYSFSGDKTSTNGEFKLIVPSATSASAVVRLN